METIQTLIDLFLHIGEHLEKVISDYQNWTYLILFLIVFCETGLVVTPFLPGDSLLFAAGSIAATGGMDKPAPLNILFLFLLLFIAAFLGDTVNYLLGKFIGKKVFERNYRLINRTHLEKTQAFYDKHGGKTIILARFVPIVRTFAPFVAGVGIMNYRKFIAYNLVGGALWVGICLSAGYLFGNIPFVKKNFSVVVLAIIVISVLPIVVEYLRQRKQKQA